MSDDEKIMQAGRMVTERSAAKRDAAMLAQRIKESGSTLNQIGIILTTREDPPEHARAIPLLERFSAAGMIDEIISTIREHGKLERRIAEISTSLRDAGLE